jgi:hypothetical membrane protein
MWDRNKLASSDQKRSILAMGSILGPIILTFTVVVLGFIRPDYSHSMQLMSELGEVGAPNAIFMNLATAILGVSILMFALGLYGIARGTSGRVGSIIMLIGGICMIGGGIFPCDPGCVPVSFIGTLHETVSLIGFSAVIFAPFAISQEFTHSGVWRGYRMYSLMTGVFTALLVPVFLSETLPLWNGAIQRLMLGILFLWMEVISIKLLRISTAS